MKRLVVFFVSVSVFLAILFMLGPKPTKPQFKEHLPLLTTPLAQIEDSLLQFEVTTGALECAYTEILWNDSIRQTDFAFLYLHGFSATKHEGDTFRYSLPKRYGMNALFNRMAGHGLNEADSTRMLKFTAEHAWNKVLYDFALAKRLGKKVIIASCSTGSLLALRLALNYPEDIKAIINYSPNLGLPDPNSNLLNGPWGLQLIKALSGSNYRIVPEREDSLRVTCKPMAYSWESVVQMQHLVETAIDPDDFARIKVPVLNMVWFEDEDHQDYVINVSKAREMHDALGGYRKWVETAAKEHVVLNHQLSADLPTVYQESYNFLDEIIK